MSNATIEIQLTKGFVTVIDAIDGDLALLKWRAQANGGGRFYAAKNAPRREGGKLIMLHRIILARIVGRELKRFEDVDHRDGNPMNNRRDNLRLASRSQNSANSKRRDCNTSGYKGVSWDKNRQRWMAYISYHGHRYFLGRFDTPEAAYEAYCASARILFGEFARLV